MPPWAFGTGPDNATSILVSIKASTSENRMTRPPRRGLSAQRGINPVSIVIRSKLLQLAFKVTLTPAQNVIQTFASDRSNQSLDKRMRDRDIRYELDLLHFRMRRLACHRWKVNRGS